MRIMWDSPRGRVWHVGEGQAGIRPLFSAAPSLQMLPQGPKGSALYRQPRGLSREPGAASAPQGALGALDLMAHLVVPPATCLLRGARSQGL